MSLHGCCPDCGQPFGRIAELEAERDRLRVEKQALIDALDWIGLRARTALYDSVSEVHNIDG